MKLFKKVLAVALVGAMAVSMLTACGDSSKTADVKNALKDAGVKTTTTLNTEAKNAAAKLDTLTQKIDKQELSLSKDEDVGKIVTEMQGMNDFSFSNNSSAPYDLYIWTNGVANQQNQGHNYPYLMKLQQRHVNAAVLKRILSKNFIRQGEFKGTSADLNNLEALLKKSTDVKSVGISCKKIYGYDVLLVAVPSTTQIDQTPAGE